MDNNNDNNDVAICPTPMQPTRGQNIAASLLGNTSSGCSGEVFGKLIDSANNEELKAQRKRSNQTGRKLKEVYEGTRKMTSSLCFGDGGILNEAMLNAVVAYNSTRKREKVEKDERLAVKHQKVCIGARELLVALENGKDPSAIRSQRFRAQMSDTVQETTWRLTSQIKERCSTCPMGTALQSSRLTLGDI
jgi:hypothetical protein